MGTLSASKVLATDELLDAIAAIEIARQQAAKEAGLAAACSAALRKLHELLEHEQEALQRSDAVARHPANMDALKAQIERVKRLAAAMGPGHPAGSADRAGLRQVPRQKTWRDAQRSPARKGRRTMGRSGGR
jgi:hypothetical protein